MEFNTIYQGLISGKGKLALVGLGYVGMPIAVEFAKHVKVIGFDINEKRVNEYRNGIDATNEVGEAIKSTTVDFTADPTRLKEAKFIIVAVPTPVNPDTTPDLRPVEGASRTVGQNLTPGTIVVFESTVYPGVTEDICVPIIEKESGLKCGVDWKIGYSPERINPGDPDDRGAGRRVRRAQRYHQPGAGRYYDLRCVYRRTVCARDAAGARV